MDPSCKLFYQILLMRQGPIHKFTFCAMANDHCFELDQIIFHLSRNHTIKKLTLTCIDKHYKLPSCAFSLHQLTDLDLTYADLIRQPISIGFGSLRGWGVVTSDRILSLTSIQSTPAMSSATILSLTSFFSGNGHHSQHLTINPHTPSHPSFFTREKKITEIHHVAAITR
ncbi:hypothetical protein HanHA89_Chr10g0399031 [Helianthus annuus]|nr:hypothetical protein HanHA89_Chr10g0399031 [Helianthus annuus]